MTVLVALTLLYGVVRAGPTTPVCRAGVPCSKAGAHVRLMFARGSTKKTVVTDAAGRYRIRLMPGTWRVSVETGMRITPATFSVPRRSAARRDFAIDTGIR